VYTTLKQWYTRIAMLLFVFVCISFVAYEAFSNHRAYSTNEPELCRDKIPQVVEQFVRREFSQQLQSFYTTLPLGILCHESMPLTELTEEFEERIKELRKNKSSPEVVEKVQKEFKERFEAITKNHDDMADIAIMVVLTTGESLYYIPHIHFSHDGKLEETYMITEAQWVPFNNDSEWQKEWCTFVGYIYPDEFEEQNCH